MADAQELAEILTAFTEEQRRASLNQQKWRKITVARAIGDTQIQFETVIDEQADAAEIFEALAPIDGAIDRLKAKADLSGHYGAALNKCAEIEMSVKNHARERHSYDVANAKHNAGRRGEVGLNVKQIENLRHIRETIVEGFARVDEILKAADECRRVLGGENPFSVLDEQIKTRIHALRGERQDAA